MANHALVVGCDAYPGERADLRGAVADALAVREWLLGRDGGAVARENLTFLASCSSDGAQAGPEVVDGPAELGDFAEAVRKLVARRDVRQNDRLFVYLAGHGCRTDPLNPVLAQDAFAFTDINPKARTAGWVTIPDLVSRLRLSCFGVIIVILDACRNFPFRRPIRPGELDEQPDYPRGRSYEPRLFLLQSTLPGHSARGLPTKGETGTVRGDFTVALIDGLRGAGIAKQYDETQDRPYVVSWTNLVSYLEKAVPHQEPRGPGEGEIVLASFPDGYFDLVKLTVDVDPSQFARAADLSVRVRYSDPSAEDDPAEQVKAGPAPVEFPVPPRRQSVHARVGDAWGKLHADVYADFRVRVPVRPGGPERVRLEPGTVYRDFTRPTSGAVHIQCDDPAAALYVRDASGHAQLSGIGFAAGRVAPGMYTAVLIGSDGRPRTEPVEVDPLLVTRTEMTAPGPFSPLFGSERARLDLPPEMGWASDAAALAWILRRGHPDGALALVIAGTGGQPTDRVVAETIAGASALPLRKSGRDGDPWWALALPDALAPAMASWLTVELPDHTLTVPRLPGACTAVALGPGRLSVAVVDDNVLASPLGLALEDRSQSLLGAGERDAAALAGGFSAQLTGVAAAVVRDAANQRRDAHGLAASADPADAAFLLPAGPWAVFVDHPAGRPLSIGALPGPGTRP